MSALRRAMMAADANLDYLLDSQGRKICTTLDDGTRLRWRQMVKNGDFSDGYSGWVKESNVTITTESNTCKIVCTSGNNGLYQKLNFETQEKCTLLVISDISVISGSTCLSNLGSDRKIVNTNKSGFYTYSILTQISDVKDTRLAIYSYGAGCFLTKNENAFELDAMFANVPSLTPKTYTEFASIFKSKNADGTLTDLGYTPYTDDPIECIVRDGYIFKITT